MSYYNPYAKVIGGRGTPRRGRYLQPRAAAAARTRYRARRQLVPRTMGPQASESKYFDSFVDGAAIAEGTAWTGTELDPTANSLFTPNEGSDIDNRIGRKVSVYKIVIRGSIQSAALPDQADIVGSPACRIILYMDKQTNGTQAQGEEVMASPGAATTALCSSTFQNLANLGRFRVLRDKYYKLGLSTAAPDYAALPATSSQNHPHIPFKLTVKFNKPITVKFNATNGGTIGDIVDNSFHLIGTKSGTGFVTTINYQCRTYYKDQ